jgi:hypothetical protein
VKKGWAGQTVSKSVIALVVAIQNSSSSAPAKKTVSSGSVLGQVLEDLSNAFGNAGLVMDAATVVDTGSIAGSPLDVATYPVAIVANAVSASSSCAAGFFEDGSAIKAEANCELQGTVLAASGGFLSN